MWNLQQQREPSTKSQILSTGFACILPIFCNHPACSYCCRLNPDRAVSYPLPGVCLLVRASPGAHFCLPTLDTSDMQNSVAFNLRRRGRQENFSARGAFFFIYT